MNDVIVLNEPLRQTTQKSGAVKFHVAIKQDPVVINLNPITLGKEVALAIQHHLKSRLQGISATASPATIRARESAQRAASNGEAWALKRYSGGRIGLRLPALTNRLFNDSGRFAESLIAQAAKDGTWRINVATNRLDPQTANGGADAVQRIWQRLVQLIPEFADMGKLMAESDIVRARVKTAQKMVQKATGLGAVVKTAAAIAKEAFDAADELLSTG